MSASKSVIPRTIQWWRLIDARNGNTVQEIDWHAVLGQLHGKHRSHTIESREQIGNVRAIAVEASWKPSLDVSNLQDAITPIDHDTTYGLVLAGGKDFVPNQMNMASGDQKPLGIDGAGWEPVDNLFVWFAPMGNIFGVLAESVSAARSKTFAEWLTRTMHNEGLLDPDDPSFAWGVHPVIDKQQANRLKTAQGLRSMTFAGLFGNNVRNASGLKRIFGRNDTKVGALRIEIKVSRASGHSSPDDDEAILKWFNEEFGALDGSVTKAQVVVEEAPGADTPMTEIDLLHHRLTRKVKVSLAPGATRSFEASTALGVIVGAYCNDKNDLVRLRAKIE